MGDIGNKYLGLCEVGFEGIFKVLGSEDFDGVENEPFDARREG